MHNITLRSVRVNIVAVEKRYVLYILSVCLCVSVFVCVCVCLCVCVCVCVCTALVNRYAKCTRRIISSSVACPDTQNFSTLSHKRHDFQKQNTEYNICVSIFSTASV